MAQEVDSVDLLNLSERDKLIIARSPFFMRTLLAALLLRNEDVAIDLFEYVSHYPDLKVQLERYVTTISKGGRIELPASKGPSGRRRQVKNQQRRHNRR